MSNLNISRKILAPTLPSAIVSRERLSHLLKDALGPSNDPDAPALYHLVLLCAPAGYGKTTLLAETVKRLALPCCWLFLDRSDLAGATFLTTLLASIRRRFPDFGAELEGLLTDRCNTDELFFQTFLDALINALTTDLPVYCVLALCNYQEVNDNATITQIVNQLLKRLPPQCLLVIESRALPNLELAPLMASRHLFGIGSRSLQFSAQDVQELALVQGLSAFSEEEAVQVATAFDGWITGILLGSRLGTTQFDTFISPSGTKVTTSEVFPNRQHLFAFVTKEVFRNDAAIYRFLKQTSVLDQLNPPLCDALLETSDAASILESAERQGLFVVHTSSLGESSYLCHPLLRELFQEELRRHECDSYRLLHQRAATLLYQRHEYETALHHALEAQEDDLAIQILLEAAPTLLDQGKSEVILRSLDHFPLHFAQKSPQLLLLWVNTYLRRSDFAKARLFLEQAESLVTSGAFAQSSSEHAPIWAEIAIARGKLFLYQGEHLQAQEHFQQALGLVSPAERVLHARAHQQLGLCLILSGRPVHQGIEQFQQALGLCHPQLDQRLIGELHHQLANAYAWTGNYAIAEHHRQRIRVIQDQLNQPQSIINNLTGLGLLKMRQGCVEEAEALFRDILGQTAQSPRFLSSKGYALLGFGELELTCQRFQHALMHLEEALALARQLEDCYLLNSTLSKLALVYLRMGESHTAQCLLEQITVREDQTRSYDGLSLTLMQGTVLFAKQSYGEAKTLLEEVTRVTGEIDIQWLHVQALIRLAACCLAQGERAQAKKTLQQVKALNAKGEHDYCIQVECQAYPAVQFLMQEVVDQGEQLDLQIPPPVRLTISALGEPTVVIDSIPVTRWRMPRAMELCFFLLESKQPLRKEQIITALWPEADDMDRFNQMFRSTTHFLRKVIGDACLIQRSGQYCLDLGAGYGQFWYDVTAFEEQQHLASAALEEEDDESAAPAFQNMVDLYRGDYGQAFYSDWCIPRRDTLRQASMEARRQLALIAWRNEAYDESLQHWQQLLIFDSCLETAHYGVMRCYLQMGKRDLALRQYQRCRQELDTQLEAKPGPRLQKLYQRLANAQI